jgi:hypothetical protein
MDAPLQRIAHVPCASRKTAVCRRWSKFDYPRLAVAWSTNRDTASSVLTTQNCEICSDRPNQATVANHGQPSIWFHSGRIHKWHQGHARKGRNMTVAHSGWHCQCKCQMCRLRTLEILDAILFLSVVAGKARSADGWLSSEPTFVFHIQNRHGLSLFHSCRD